MPIRLLILWLPDGAGHPGRGMIGNANITPPNPRRYLYHAYLSFMAARGYQYVMNLTAFGQAVRQTLKKYEHTLLKRRTK
jgi:putative DNA primase/helicase